MIFNTLEGSLMLFGVLLVSSIISVIIVLLAKGNYHGLE